MGSETREKILRLVAEGKITVEQGMELLEAADPGEPPPRKPGPGSPGGPGGPRTLGGLIDDVLSMGLGRGVEHSAHHVAHLARAVGVPRPPRPPRRPRPPRPARPHPHAPGAMRMSFSAPARRPGFGFEDLVELKARGVPREYVEGMRQLFEDLDPDEVGECWENGVDLEYAAAICGLFGELEPEELVELRGNGVTVEFAAGLKERFPELEAGEVLEAAANGIGVEDLDYFVGEDGGPPSRHNRRAVPDEPDGPAGDEGPGPA